MGICELTLRPPGPGDGPCERPVGAPFEADTTPPPAAALNSYKYETAARSIVSLFWVGIFQRKFRSFQTDPCLVTKASRPQNVYILKHQNLSSLNTRSQRHIIPIM